MGITQQQDLAQLGLSSDTSVDEKTVRKAYLKLSKKVHPDKGGSNEAFQRLSSAYQRLMSSRDSKSTERPPTRDDERQHKERKSPTSSNSRSNDGSSAGKPSAEKNRRRESPRSRREEPPHEGEPESSQGETPFSEQNSSSSRDEEEFWGDEYYHFFRKAYQTGYADEDEFDEYFTNWETATRQQRAQQRRENVKRGYDFRDTRSTRRTKSCMFCGIRKQITKQDAREHGLSWRGYEKSQTVEGYPSLRTCWSCKNKHDSVLTQNMAERKFRVLKEHGSAFFRLLRNHGRCFNHQPVTHQCNYTRRSTYFWYPDVEKEAISRGWRPRGRRKLQVPWVRQDIPTNPETLLQSSCSSNSSKAERSAKRQKTSALTSRERTKRNVSPVSMSATKPTLPEKTSISALTPRERKKRKVSVVSLSATKPAVSKKVVSVKPKKLFCVEESFASGEWRATSVTNANALREKTPKKLVYEDEEPLLTSGDWRVAGGIDY